MPSVNMRTVWYADLATPDFRGEVGRKSYRPETSPIRIAGGTYGPETREMLIWVLENTPKAEISATLRVTFEDEIEATAFRVRWG